MSQLRFAQVPSWLPTLDTSLSDRREILALAAVLIVGLTFVTPVLALVTGLPALVFVALVGAGYGACCLLVRRVFAGALVGLLVTTTFAANVPLVSGVDFPGALGPQLWLMQLPLVAAVVLVLLIGPREVLAGATKPDYLFTAFVGWTLLAALFGATMRLDAALWFSLFMLQALIVFVLFRYAVQRDVFSFELVAQLFVATVVAHSVVAVAQFLNGGHFGVTALGVSGSTRTGVISLGPLGDFVAGTHVAGFTGMSFHLGMFIILAIPMIVILALRASGWRRFVFVAVSLMMAAVLRATGTDAGKGGLLVALVVLGAALVYVKRSELLGLMSPRSSQPTTTKTTHAKNAILAVFAALVSIAALLYPSSTTGSNSAVTDIGSNSGSTGSGTVGGAGGASAGSSGAAGAGGGSDAANAQFEALESLLSSLKIPLFDISTIGGRVQQYVAGIDLFLQYPLFGIGGMNFYYYSPEYGFANNPLPIHNAYIAVLAGTGLPGFLLYSLLLGSILWYGWKAAKQANDGLLHVGLLCGAVGYLAFAFWDIATVIMVTSFPFWALAGALIGTRDASVKQ